MSLLRALLLVSVVVLALASPSFATQKGEFEVLLNRLRPGASLDNFLWAIQTEFRRLDTNRDGAISPADIEINRAFMEAAHRASFVSRLLAADLDGDGAVTVGEIRQKRLFDQRTQANASPDDPHIQRLIRRLRDADRDQDGRVGWREAANAARSQPNLAAKGFEKRVHQVLDLAGGGTKVVRLPDLERVAEAFFRKVDSDRNGTISQDEMAAVRRMRQAANRKWAEEMRAAKRRRKQSEREAPCAMPKASKTAQVILLSAYKTEALSTAAIGSYDEVTYAGKIVVEDGDDPLYVVVATRASVVWQLSGAVDRIEQLVLGNRSGATGLPAQHVTVIPASKCLSYFSTIPSLQSARSVGSVRRIVGKAPAGVFADRRLSAFSIPSGRLQKVDRSRKLRALREKYREKSGASRTPGTFSDVVRKATLPIRGLEWKMHRLNLGGVIDIDSGAVIAGHPVSPYEVLPQEPGLIQLVKNGSLSQNRYNEFLIHKKIRFPPGLTDQHSVKFLLLRGVPMPDGHPGESKVVSEETGEKLMFEKKK